ncbi:MAG: hypothetical protein ACI9EQ_001364, partial [Bacteroidia bacterium]
MIVTKLIKLKHIISGIPALFVAGILVSCGNDMTEIQAFTIDTNEPVEISTGVTMQLSDSGLKKYVLNTPRIEKYIINEEDIYKFPIGFELLTFDTLGVQVTSISAKRGS